MIFLTKKKLEKVKCPNIYIYIYIYILMMLRYGSSTLGGTLYSSLELKLGSLRIHILNLWIFNPGCHQGTLYILFIGVLHSPVTSESKFFLKKKAVSRSPSYIFNLWLHRSRNYVFSEIMDQKGFQLGYESWLVMHVISEGRQASWHSQAFIYLCFFSR
jgi:hypothetical protein